MAATGSIAVDDVVPTLATTKNGVSPAARSSAMAAASASGRRAKRVVDLDQPAAGPGCSPAMRTAFSIELWAWVEV